MPQIRPESGRLTSLAWAPRTCDGYPLDLDGSQRFSRPRHAMAPLPYPPMIGGVAATFQLYDVYLFTGGVAKPPKSFYVGGAGVAEIGNTGPGIGGNPANFLKLRG